MFTLIAVLAPLVGAILSGVARPLLGKLVSVWSTIVFMLISAASAIMAYRGGVQPALHIAHWVQVGTFTSSWTLRQDQLSLVMLVMVSVVSMLIHVYSVGYMAHDKTPQRFMSYISLFTFAMLMLVTSNNLLQLFFGWEGVGLVSYLLINYWYDRKAANDAAIKAFIVNRVGDLAFAVGIALAYFTFGSIQFDVIFAGVSSHVGQYYTLFGTQMPVLEVISFLLFIGAMGKSAQIVLHTWLADAMEGPTPISALIHAATMVAAGVFMIVRMSPLINAAPAAMGFITFVGGTTAFFAATIGCVQNDIKRVIAYSTCSQLGYMFLAAGVGAYPVAMFHLINHALFKALLFLAAGSVIHAMSDEQDIRLMGGLAGKLPFTCAMMLIGSLALIAIPPFSGYYSKDAILDAAFSAHTPIATYGWVCGTLGAGLTAFYTSRLFFLVFTGKSRAPKHVQDHVHESPFVMLLPLLVLGIGAFASGFVLKPYFIGSEFQSFWGNSINVAANSTMFTMDKVANWAENAPLALAIFGILVAALFYLLVPALPGRLSQSFSPVYKFLLNKWYFDEMYDALLVRPSLRLAKFAWRFGDEQVIDGVPKGLAALTSDASAQAVKLQTGSIALYAFIMLIGLVVFVSLFIWVR
ncbi:NADH-quinone oxidoreductase subunit L [Acidocella aminolytica]|uniref:NADH-quinone oxidoreductase subunit L n=1 Tax=Acidocella aminolytica 101 = DSM 11237 TaxID=1120923 RepID=A0A0D6PD86_9PROT|nr:NADH-quinone oxidoreductase subunit L [Acidocella aminolytica]GAN79715.1 NADH-quinone oxidoreductase subunit L [Acidocella aminolytica 101 = DSM 11237]GBQ39829.1 NADH-quinone oxidoreductase chain L [Acidocella aminolytica 101 = DSM 11237]SHE73328.1 NADH dehydrogenase subunit L [Acidocella aminolytica 101 = DSM 11237]